MFTLFQRSSLLLRIFSVTLASGIFLIAVSALGHLCLPRLHKFGKHTGEHRPVPSSEVDSSMNLSLDAAEVWLHS